MLVSAVYSSVDTEYFNIFVATAANKKIQSRQRTHDHVCGWHTLCSRRIVGFSTVLQHILLIRRLFLELALCHNTRNTIAVFRIVCMELPADIHRVKTRMAIPHQIKTQPKQTARQRSCRNYRTKKTFI